MAEELDEAFYDAEIAPLLLKAAQLCQEKGISMVCWDSFSRTTAICKDSPFAGKLVDLAAKCQGNVDGLFMALVKDAHQNGCGNSLFLHRYTTKDHP